MSVFSRTPRGPFVDASGELTPSAQRWFVDLLRRVGGVSAQTNTELGQDLATHTSRTDNPHETDKTQVGLGNVDNTSDAAKPVSTVQQAALDLKANTADLGTMAEQDADAVAVTGGTVLLASGSLGYAVGNGGTVVQATSKSTGVTLNKPCGQITMNAAALAANTAVQFTLTNSTVALGDRLVCSHDSGGTFGAYHVQARAAAGSAIFSVRNLTGGSLSEAIGVGYTVIKGATT